MRAFALLLVDAITLPVLLCVAPWRGGPAWAAMRGWRASIRAVEGRRRAERSAGAAAGVAPMQVGSAP